MYTWYVGGYCRVVPITKDRPAEVIEAELRVQFGNQGWMQRVIDVTNDVHTGLMDTWGKPGRSEVSS